jgi:hypothetical protein
MNDNASPRCLNGSICYPALNQAEVRDGQGTKITTGRQHENEHVRQDGKGRGGAFGLRRELSGNLAR